MEDKPLVSEDLQLLFQPLNLPVHAVCAGQMVIPIEHVLQEVEQVPVQALHSGLDFPAVVVGKYQHVDAHPHPQPNSGIPDAA